MERSNVVPCHEGSEYCEEENGLAKDDQEELSAQHTHRQ